MRTRNHNDVQVPDANMPVAGAEAGRITRAIANSLRRPAMARREHFRSGGSVAGKEAYRGVGHTWRLWSTGGLFSDPFKLMRPHEAPGRVANPRTTFGE